MRAHLKGRLRLRWWQSGLAKKASPLRQRARIKKTSHPVERSARKSKKRGAASTAPSYVSHPMGGCGVGSGLLAADRGTSLGKCIVHPWVNFNLHFLHGSG